MASSADLLNLAGLYGQFFFCSADHRVSGCQWSVVTRVDHVSGGQWSEVSFALKSTMDRPRGGLTPDCTAVLN